MEQEMAVKERYIAIVNLLFAYGQEMSTKKLQKILKITPKQVREALEIPQRAPDQAVLLIQSYNHKLRLVTHPRFASVIRQTLFDERDEELSSEARETLAIVAYRQPISRAQIDKIRGYDSRRPVQKLLRRGLIQPGKTPQGGDPRAHYYEVSWKFLEYFGLSNVDDLKQQTKGKNKFDKTK